jgi:hypothetical protein
MSKILRNETRQDTWQLHLCVHSDVKRFEAPFATAIMAEKRQELSQMTTRRMTNRNSTLSEYKGEILYEKCQYGD